MTDAERERFVAALVAKHRRYLGQEVSDETLAGIVGTTVVDTELVLEGAVTIGEFEQ